jgi:hypothetical protein
MRNIPVILKKLGFAKNNKFVLYIEVPLDPLKALKPNKVDGS